jgi:hypothetical protein
MIHINIDPYDMLIQHNVRLNLLEQQIRDLQAQHIVDKRTIDQQQKTITQLQQNEGVLSEAIGHLLLKQPK